MDIELDSNGKILLNGTRLNLIRDRPTLVAQRLSVRLRTYLGEWFLDTKMGIDWFADILIKNVSKQTVDNIIQNEIKKDSFVISVKTFRSRIVERNYECYFSVNIVGLDHVVQIKYLANENNLYVVNENGERIAIEV